MSELVFDRAFAFASPITEWYRDRAFKIAFAVSVVIHAGLIAFVPGFRTVDIDAPRVLDVQIMQAEPGVVAEKPVVPAKREPQQSPPESLPTAPELPPVMRQPQPEVVPEPVLRQPQPDRPPEPVLSQPQPEPPAPPRADILQAPRTEPQPEFVVPAPTPRAQVRAEPKMEARPEPKIEPRPEPPLVTRTEPARVEPRPQPRPVPSAVPRPAPTPEPDVAPRQEPRLDVKPLPREVQPPVSQMPVAPPPAVVAAPRIESPVPSVQAPVPAPVVAPEANATVAPQAKPDERSAKTLTEQYRQIISAKIKRFEDYPVVAKRRHWEGTTVVQLSITPEGKIEAISVVEKSGHEILDDAAVKMIRKAVPLPIPPEGLRTVLIPIKFRLDS